MIITKYVGEIMKKITVLLLVMFAPFLVTTVYANTLDDVKKRGYVNCGVSGYLPGMSLQLSETEWLGLDIDLCRAVAAATLGDAKKVKFISTTAQNRFDALWEKKVDILSRTTTWTLTRDTKFEFNFAAVTLYDGQGFLVKKTPELTSALHLAGKGICMVKGGTEAMLLAKYFGRNGLKYKNITVASFDDGLMALLENRCQAMTSMKTALAPIAVALAEIGEYVILPETISKEPIGPLVRHDDEQWTDIVKWTHYAMVNAEELGISSKNVKNIVKEKTNIEAQRMLGQSNIPLGEFLGLSSDWAYNIILQVGNYGEVFERNLGAESLLNLDRGLNALWFDGGLQYSPPFR